MNLVLTIATGAVYTEMSTYTHPTLQNYAHRIGAEFRCIDGKSISTTSIHWEKFQIYNLFDEYDRILYVDTDLIIRDDAPNIFDIVPKDKLGMFNEAPFTDRSKELMIDACKAYGRKLETWDGKYYNTGVIIASRCHRDVFKKPEFE